MNKVITPKEAIDISSKLRSEDKIIVLTGGCFDVLHFGHISFLKNAKNIGDKIFLLLESDGSVKIKKGKDRPVNNQKNRANNLARYKFVDYVIMLPKLEKNEEYDRLVTQIRPDVIASTKNDPNSAHKRRQAKLVGAEYKEVIERISNLSTTSLLKGKS
ncbi:MAG: hypothetical protein A2152_00320 [Candidatus Levybacteria bacterium RBG_16_35_6]|nr:MAG: Glycerol-3-phosphate cytidyltransferase TagD [Candidatus Levybacteria bacterium GW2011_GWA2_36_13]KKQ01131.1 MAG: Glycerol-3-phosphate cytidyltransferase TagD [Candidatus Levybacteria bacterium GW2011_GWB1_36_18]KKQ58413.1 MAG: Glycerol-3-phosphate cytidyltransferase TagD [Microgenomates group bacterium GW2011_GWC1_38_14]KKR16460.1 MAG: Glycerol-3-phosphate cytidyltransferase TagD [Candidatus Levybacteria bacterium GW2011_GWA1_39_34]OGH08950.1 MAG: hypothetical protein A2152_00320 [Cand